MDTKQANLSIEQVLGILRRRAGWILLCFVLVAGAAYGFSKHQTKKYTATASLVFNNNQLSQQAAGLQVISGSNQRPKQNTNLKLVQLGDMATKTAGLLGQGLTKEKVSADLSVSARANRTSSTFPRPRLAGACGQHREHLHQRVRQGAAEQQSRLLRLGVEARQQAAAALSPKQTAQPCRARPGGSRPVARGPRRTAQRQRRSRAGRDGPDVAVLAEDIEEQALGAFLGLLLGLGIAFLLERLDRRIREPKDLEAVYGLPLLGVVPESSALSRSAKGKKNAGEALPASEAEAFHLIRAHLRYFNVDKELRTLMSNT